MIFLSHNWKDKDIVEPIALRLRETFGQENIFYDSWSIQPGEGIIDKMNEGLSKCKIFLFFVSKNSLQSKMVNLEWHSALYGATNAKMKVVPIKLDDCLMPPILWQSLYIDMYSIGMELAVRQIQDLTEERNTFQESSKEFQNIKLDFHVNPNIDSQSEVVLNFEATRLTEPIAHFVIICNLPLHKLKIVVENEPYAVIGTSQEFSNRYKNKYTAIYIGLQRVLTPNHPVSVNIKSIENKTIHILEAFHEQKKNSWRNIQMGHTVKVRIPK